MNFASLCALSVLAGAFIAIGAVFSTAVAAGAGGKVPYGLTRLVSELVFSLGLILVVIGGAGLFTGNNLIVMAWAIRKISTRQRLRNWVIVFAGNFIGACAIAMLVYFSAQHTLGAGAVGWWRCPSRRPKPVWVLARLWRAVCCAMCWCVWRCG